MRYTVIKGLDDDVYITVYGVSAVCAVMEIGTCLSPLVFEATVTGDKVIEMFMLSSKEKSQINPSNRYNLVAFDD